MSRKLDDLDNIEAAARIEAADRDAERAALALFTAAQTANGTSVLAAARDAYLAAALKRAERAARDTAHRATKPARDAADHAAYLARRYPGSATARERARDARAARDAAERDAYRVEVEKAQAAARDAADHAKPAELKAIAYLTFAELKAAAAVARNLYLAEVEKAQAAARDAVRDAYAEVRVAVAARPAYLALAARPAAVARAERAEAAAVEAVSNLDWYRRTQVPTLVALIDAAIAYAEARIAWLVGDLVRTGTKAKTKAAARYAAEAAAVEAAEANYVRAMASYDRP